MTLLYKFELARGEFTVATAIDHILKGRGMAMKRNRLLKVSLEIAVVIVVIVGFKFINYQIEEKRKRSFKPIADSGKYAYQVEELKVDGDDVVLTGCFFELRKVDNIETEIGEGKVLGIVIYDINSEVERDIDGNEKMLEGIRAEVFLDERPDVDAYFKCDYDYSHCGFTARIDKSDIDLVNGSYQIIFKPKEDGDEGVMFDGNAYIHKGKISFINPTNMVQLDVSGTDLEEIVSDGLCVVSVPEADMYVYQYGWKLYWIAGPGFSFSNNGRTYIQYHLSTTQFDRLPKDRTDNGWYWDNIGAFFEDDEATAYMNCGRYRVFIRDIPDEYSVNTVSTGCYVDENFLWGSRFRPYYSFNDRMASYRVKKSLKAK